MALNGSKELSHDAGAGRVEDELPPEIVERLKARPSWLRRAADSTVVLTIVSYTLLIVAWQTIKVVFSVPDFILPSPRVVATTMIDRWSFLVPHIMVTLKQILVGFVLAVILGFAIGIGIAFSRLFDRLSYPILVATQAIPKIAIGPIVIAWLGFGFRPNVFIAVLIAFFPIVINTSLGLKSIDPQLIRLAQSMGATGWRTFWKLRLPNSLPNVFGGLKMGMTFSTIGVVIGEFIAGSSGLGFVVQSAAGQLQTALAFASLVVLSLLAMVLFYAVEIVERLVVRWKPSHEIVVTV